MTSPRITESVVRRLIREELGDRVPGASAVSFSDSREPHDAAGKLLADMLGAGPRLMIDVRFAAESACIPWAKIEGAKAQLDVRVTKADGEWTWALPGKPLAERKNPLSARVSLDLDPGEAGLLYGALQTAIECVLDPSVERDEYSWVDYVRNTGCVPVLERLALLIELQT